MQTSAEELGSTSYFIQSSQKFELTKRLTLIDPDKCRGLGYGPDRSDHRIAVCAVPVVHWDGANQPGACFYHPPHIWCPRAMCSAFNL